MSKYICDHADECESIACPSSKGGYDPEYRGNWENHHKDGYREITYIGSSRPCSKETVYFIPYFEYLMRKTLKGKK